jgi:hypothetical protein
MLSSFVEPEHAMNKRLLTFFLGTALLGFLPRAVAANRWETLRAINLVENPTNQTRVGPRGELGPYQFRASTWRMHTGKPFSMATDRATADEVAISHYEWIKRGLVEAGIDPNPYNIAMAWNCGLGRVVAGHVPAGSYRYAEQVTNLVDVMARAQAVAVTAAMPAAPAPASASVPAPTQPGMQVQFAEGTLVPHYVLLTDPDVPRLVVKGEAPHYVVASPPPPIFSLAVAD